MLVEEAAIPYAEWSCRRNRIVTSEHVGQLAFPPSKTIGEKSSAYARHEQRNYLAFREARPEWHAVTGTDDLK